MTNKSLPMINGERQYVIIENRGTERDPHPNTYQGNVFAACHAVEEYAGYALRDDNGDDRMPPRVFLIGADMALTEAWVINYGGGRYRVRHSDQTVPDIEITPETTRTAIAARTEPV